MFVLGLLILAAAVVCAVELILANRGQMTFHMWNWTWHFDAFWLAVIGAIILFTAVVAFGLMRISATHARRTRAERMRLEAENARLAERATQQPVRQAPGKPYPAGTAAPAAGTAPAGTAAYPPAGERTGMRGGAHAMNAEDDTTERHRHRIFSRH